MDYFTNYASSQFLRSMSSTFLSCLILLSQLTLAVLQSDPISSSSVSSFIPRCARDCVNDFIRSSFPGSVCGDRSGLACLCQSNSVSGFTLGEGSLRCVVSLCPEASILDLREVYGICDDVDNAVLATHATIEASIPISSTIFLATSTSKITTSSTKMHTTLITKTTSSVSPGITLDTGSPPAVPSKTFLSTLSRVASISGPSSSTAAAAAASANALQPVLNTAQIVGVTIAGVALVVLIVSVLIFLFCAKRNKARRDSDASFGAPAINTVFPPPPGYKPTKQKSQPLASPLPASVSPKAQEVLGVPPRTNENRWSLWRKQVNPRDIGVAIAPEANSQMAFDASPVSVASYRTTSRLLPDKPVYNLQKSPPNFSTRALSTGPQQQSLKPPMPAAQAVGLRVISATPPPVQPNPKEWRPRAPNQRSVGHGSVITHKPSDPFLDVPRDDDPRARMYAMEKRRASIKDLPRIDTYGNLNNSWNPTKQSLVPPLPLPAPTFNSSGPRPPLPSKNPRRSSYVSPTTGNTPMEQKPFPLSGPSSTYAPIAPQLSEKSQQPTQPQFSKYAPLKTKQNEKRPLTYYTTGSETSIEEDGLIDEEVDYHDQSAWPSPLRVLSPVIESPQNQKLNGTPLSQIRYPPIPGSVSSQIQQRTPPASVPREVVETPTRKPPPRSGSARSPGKPVLVSVKPPSRERELLPSPPFMGFGDARVRAQRPELYQPLLPQSQGNSYSNNGSRDLGSSSQFPQLNRLDTGRRPPRENFNRNSYQQQQQTYHELEDTSPRAEGTFFHQRRSNDSPDPMTKWRAMHGQNR